MKKLWLIVLMVVVVLTGCSDQSMNKEGSDIQSDQFILGDASFVAPKNWAGNYEINETKDQLSVFHICEQVNNKQELFTLKKVDKEAFQSGGQQNKDALVTQVGNDFYLAFAPQEMVYSQQTECKEQYDEMYLPFEGIKGRITVR
ncbi:hypothetical protein [Bacillus solimangrovi]|uniref:Lipoprotein n=1 Tax=Bacillus solimangrovi TaxID=1305675 RepID=A0A1E5LIY0_9BACI|nr:hypothetical protein [Bacillus solimangrovi]OEH94035.1 hypothetical protein BFG57_10340 [Bacillus solimangrovi]